MSQLQVTTLEANTLSANVITAGETTVNSAGIFLSNKETDYSGVVSTSAVIVSETDENYTMSAEFNNSADSYTAGNATITNFDTYIRLTATATDPTFTSPAFSHFGTTIGKIVIKIRRITGSGWDGSVYHSTAGHGFSGSFRAMMTQPSWNGTDWAYIQLDANNLFAGGDDFITNTITRIRFDFGTTSADVFEIDYIRFYPVNIIKAVVTTPSINISGTSYTTLPNETVNTQIFTANGTWIKPSWANTGNELVIVHMWGGGGGCATTTGVYTASGGGGAFVFGYFKSSQVNATCNVVVGLGGTRASNSAASQDTQGANGGVSVFYANTTNSLSAYGGVGGFSNTTLTINGSGGGWISSGNSSSGGAPLGGVVASNGGVSTFGGGGGSNSFNLGGSSIYGGGGGARGSANRGISIYGGGGGAVSAPVSLSVYGGNGGNSSVSPTTPGGGGGAGNPFGDGARGEVRVYTLRYTGP